MTKVIEGRNGGKLYPQERGQPAPAGAGRKANPFKQHIQDLADLDTEIVLSGRIVSEDGTRAETTVRVAVSLPGALGIVAKAYKLAAKGDAQARKWLTETGWGKNVIVGNDPDNPIDGGFVIVLPSNER